MLHQWFEWTVNKLSLHHFTSCTRWYGGTITRTHIFARRKSGHHEYILGIAPRECEDMIHTQFQGFTQSSVAVCGFSFSTRSTKSFGMCASFPAPSDRSAEAFRTAIQDVQRQGWLPIQDGSGVPHITDSNEIVRKPNGTQSHTTESESNEQVN